MRELESKSARQRSVQLPDGPLRLEPPLLARNPVRWFAIFGPGAVIASLTIGTGELVFSSRAGALFGYRVLWLILLTCLMKWVLLFGAARHMVVSGKHPFERYASLPGPKGWFPVTMLLLAAGAFPIWVGFVGGVVGTLAENYLGYNAHVWGMLAVLLVLLLLLKGGYPLLERVQLWIVCALLVTVSVSLLLLNPDWPALLKGFFVPSSLQYPVWIDSANEIIASRPVWLEAATYVGVIGGSAYDYLAYVSFLRHKAWGLSGPFSNVSSKLELLSDRQTSILRDWVTAPLIDCSISFLVVLIFSSVFVASGAVILAPAQRIPSGDDLLTFQAEFVTSLHPWLLFLYLAGAVLALVGTLYGTLGVAPAVLGEILYTLFPVSRKGLSERVNRLILIWCGGGGIGVLVWSLAYRMEGGMESRPPTLVEILTPANLFTGVLACGFVCVLAPWIDRRFLPPKLRMNLLLQAASLLAGALFLILGGRGYWDFGAERLPEWGAGWSGAIFFLLTLATGWLAAWAVSRVTTKMRSSPDKTHLADCDS